MKRRLFHLVFGMCCVGVAGAHEWHLEWSDEFSKPGAPDPAKWVYEEGYVRNRESQYYTVDRRENARVEKGLLVIEARKDKYAIPGQEGKVAEYTSASLTTRGKASWTRGRIDVRAKLPEGRGTWPAIWMLGTNIDKAGWPACGEIDIMEFVGHQPGMVHVNVHTRDYNHTRGNGRGASHRLPDASSAFHVYSVEWTAERLRFTVDGTEVFVCANDGKGVGSWPFDAPQYLILNLAIGGAWGGQKGIDDSVFPCRFLVDYVRVYRKE